MASNQPRSRGDYLYAQQGQGSAQPSQQHPSPSQPDRPPPVHMGPPGSSPPPMPGQPGVRMPQQQQQQQQQPYQLTQAQLSPAVGLTSDTDTPPQPPQTDEKPSQGLKDKLSHLFHPSSSSDGRNVGYTPTPKMIAQHEKQHLVPHTAERPLYQFQVTKLRSWRTGYVRLLALYEKEFVTLDPSTETPTQTNRWPYASLTEWLALPKEKESILLQVDQDKLKLSCHNVSRSAVLTALLECQDRAGQTHDAINFSSAERYTRQGTRVAVSLIVKPYGITEVHPQSRQPLRTYDYKDISSVSLTAQNEIGIVLHFHQPAKSRLYLVHSSRRGGSGRSDLLSLMGEHFQTLGLELTMEKSLAVPEWIEQRRNFDYGTVATTWQISKTTRRHDSRIVGSEQGWVGGIVSRHLAITGKGYLVERDGAGMVSCRRLADLYAVVRHTDSDQITLECSDGSHRTYTCKTRDAFLVSVLDAATTLGLNSAVHLVDHTSSGYCLSSLSTTAPQNEKSSGLFQPISIPMYCLRRVHALSTQAYAFVSREFEHFQQGQAIDVARECERAAEACREFNATVLPTGEGLPGGDSDKTLAGSIGALWGLISKLLDRSMAKADASTSTSYDRQLAEHTAGTFFQTLYRMSKTPTGYKMSTELTTMQESIQFLWDINEVFCRFWAFKVLNILLSGLPERDLEAEYVNKSVILRTGGSSLVYGLVSAMLDASTSMTKDGRQKVSDLILMVASSLLQSLLCSYHDTTAPDYFAAFIRALAERYGALLSTLRSQTPFVIENTALLLHLLSTHAPETAASIRDAALSSGILLQHFYAAIFSPMEGQRFLSRYLCSLWLAGPMDCDEKRLLKRIVPHGFLTYLSMPPLSRLEEEQLDELERDALESNIPESSHGSTFSDEDQEDTVSAVDIVTQERAAGTNTSRLRSRIALAKATASNPQKSQQENFRVFFHVLTQDQSLPDLIWSQQTRRELRIALESEIQYIQRETEARGEDSVAWNHQQFQVKYPSLENEVRVGNVYMRLWLQAGDGFVKSWEEPVRLFELLFRRFLCEIDRNSKVTIMCIRCLERLYAIHAMKIGPFTDVMILVRSMASTKSIETQHRLLELLATLLGVSREENNEKSIDVPENAEQLLNIESIGQLCQFVAWGHTSGDQAGNILTRVLGSNSGGRSMITDGSDRGPGGDEASEQLKRARDAACPPVWFIALTSKIPPPSESIRGPFRVSDLLRLMGEGDLSPFDLVTASHVEEYDFDVDSEALREAHIDTGKWKRLNEVWQLRWQLCTDGNSTGIYTPSDVSLLAVKALTRLVDLHRSLDSRGVPYFPIPTAKRILCGSNRDVSEKGDAGAAPLSILSQALLCNDSRVVDQAAQLLHKLTLYNDEAMSKFYLTGSFFFALAYTGSNFKGIAKLLHAAHLKQHFRSGFAAAADESELPMKERSVLGHLLPEGLLFILVNYGFDRFAEVFVGNADTPEVIWTFEMRKHLIEMIRQHLGDFPLRLFQNTTTEYEYCPMPGVAYKRLEKEIFCHNYYLHNLCDEVRFPEWPIAEPVEVFRACLERFKRQVGRDELSEEKSLEVARNTLGLNAGDGGRELRKAYRNLARRWHPDKNPSGREMFEAIQSSYELLLPIVESGEKIRLFVEGDDPSETRDSEYHAAEGLTGGKSQMQTMHLLVKTQLLICRRYEKEMSRYKYPAYSVLLECIQAPISCVEALREPDPFALLGTCLLKAERAEFVKTAVELLFRTCLVSPLNSEELVTDGGVPVLASLLEYYIRAFVSLEEDAQISASKNAAQPEVIIDIIAHIVHTVAGICFFDSGRAAIKKLPDKSSLLVNWRRCIDGTLSATGDGKDDSIKKYALEGIANMAKDPELQEALIGSGVVWPLLRFMLLFDATLDHESTAVGEQDDLGISVASTNVIARYSVRALGMLSGALSEAEQSDALMQALERLLTRPIARMLRNRRTGEILRVLNSNVEKADIIWNVGMRTQLEATLSKVQKERPDNACQSVSEQLEPVQAFEYDVLKGELQIGGVYVRIFTKDAKEALSSVHDPTAFGDAIISFIAHTLNRSAMVEKIPLDEGSSNVELNSDADISVREPAFLLAMNALKILVRIDGLIDDVLCESDTAPSVLLSLLELPLDSESFDIGSDILAVMSPKQAFADSVANKGALWRLLAVLERPEVHEKCAGSVNDRMDTQKVSQRKVRGWSVLESLTSSPSIATQLLSSSGWLELLGVLVGHADFTRAWTARVGAAKTLSRLLWDPQTGTLAASLLQKLLPATLTIRLKEDPEKMVKSFDGNFDTPELIWDSSMRSELRKVMREQLGKCFARRKDEAVEDGFSLPPDVRVRYSKLEDELFIGGVYVSRFLKEPTFNLRDPNTFLELLLQRWSKELEAYTVEREIGSTKADSSSAITDAQQDVLQIVTTASVYLCKVRDSLCDKLAQWGYMSRSLAFLDDVLEKDLVGTPLLSVIRLLHVAANRIVNVEALAVCGEDDGKKGVVGLTLKAICSDSLHPDCAFMVELLKKVYLKALGDVKRARKVSRPLSESRSASSTLQESYVAMAPSPAPGEGPVRKKVTMGDDPLGMMQSLGATEEHAQATAAPQPDPAQRPQNLAAQGPYSHPPPSTGSQQSHLVIVGGFQYTEQRQGYQTPLSHPEPQNMAQQRMPNAPTPQYNQLGQQYHSQQQGPTTRGMPYASQQDRHGQDRQEYSYQQRSAMAQRSPNYESSQPPLTVPQGISSQYGQTHQQQSYQQRSAMTQATGGHSQMTSSQQKGSGLSSQYGVQERQQYSYQQRSAGLSQSGPHNAPGSSQSNSYQQMDMRQQHKSGTLQPQLMEQNLQQMLPRQDFRQQTPPHQPNQEWTQQTFAHSAPSNLRQLQQQHHQQHQQHAPSQHQYQPQGLPQQQQQDRQAPLTQQYQSHLNEQYQQPGTVPGSSSQQPLQGAPAPYPHGSTPDQNTQQPAKASTSEQPMGAPVVETVPEEPLAQQYRPTPIEGSGIDARSKEDPKAAAEQQAMSTGGAPGAAQGRTALLQQALACRLCEFLIDSVLENSTLSNVKDPASAKVHAIDLLKLLTKDPGFGPKFKLILDGLPAWKKYKSQDHSLFITGHEQKADYFLTDGGSGETKKMLTQGEASS